MSEWIGSEVRFLAERDDAAFEGLFDLAVRVIGASGVVEEPRAFSFGLSKALVPFVEGFS